MNSLFEPFWTVCPDGYQWQRNKKQGHWLLHEKRPCDESNRLPIRFSHLRRELFMDFAKLKPQPDEILRFANQFGLLVGDRKKNLSVGTVHADRLNIWQREILTMRYVIAVWTALQENDDDALAAYIHWKTNPPAAFFHAPESGDDPRPEWYTLADCDTLSERFGTAKPEQNHVLPAIWFVSDRINAKLTIVPQLYFLTQTEQIVDGFRLGIQPSQCSLLQALWLQAAAYIDSGNKRFRKCSICEKWFVAASKASLTRCEYCSDACKVKAFRHRQDDARQRFARGESIEEIAKVYGSDPKVVTGWITGRKPD